MGWRVLACSGRTVIDEVEAPVWVSTLNESGEGESMERRSRKGLRECE